MFRARKAVLLQLYQSCQRKLGSDFRTDNISLHIGCMSLVSVEWLKKVSMMALWVEGVLENSSRESFVYLSTYRLYVVGVGRVTQKGLNGFVSGHAGEDGIQDQGLGYPLQVRFYISMGFPPNKKKLNASCNDQISWRMVLCNTFWRVFFACLPAGASIVLAHVCCGHEARVPLKKDIS